MYLILTHFFGFVLFFMMLRRLLFFFFFFNDTATTEIYTLSLHDALPILGVRRAERLGEPAAEVRHLLRRRIRGEDRKSTRLNSSHGYISYAVFCLKKKKNINNKLSSDTRRQKRLNPPHTRLQ